MLLTCHVTPNAKRNELTWLDEDTVKVKITAPAVDGKANKALVDFLAEELKVKKASITIVRGLTARMKQVNVEGLLRGK